MATVVFRVAILLVAGLGCARAPGSVGAPRPRDLHDRVYLALRMREQGCLPQLRGRCCPLLKERMDQALAHGEMAPAATALDALAIACPDHRGSAIAALDRAYDGPVAPEAGSVKVAYAPRIATTDRLYWVSAFLDGKQLAGAPLAPGAHVLDVEVHVMTATGSESDALYRIKAHKELLLEPKGSRLFIAALTRREVPAGGDPFVLELTEKQRTAPAEPGKAETPGGDPGGLVDAKAVGAAQEQGAQPAAAKKAAAVGMGRLKTFPRPRLPSELSRGQAWMSLLQVCVDPGGRVDTVSPIAHTPHPRLLGVLIDSLAHAEYLPYTIGGKGVPFCYPLRINVLPG